MKTLKEQREIRIMLEDWEAKVKSLTEEVDIALDAKPKNGVKILSPELKVSHKKSGIRYTVDSVGPRDVILRTPEGDTFLVSADNLEAEYTLG